MNIAENLRKIKKELTEGVCLVVVSKTRKDDELMEAYHCGQRIFGENRVQELTIKHERLPDDIEWHLIGHLQTNKIKYIAPFVGLIHSIDSWKLLAAVNKEGVKANRRIRCLLQFHIAEEETKYGFDLETARQMLSSSDFLNLTNVEICGVMGMATFTENHEQVRHEFDSLKKIFDTLKHDFFNSNESFREISMGMSDDYIIAIQAGSTMVRIGNSIFGER